MHIESDYLHQKSKELKHIILLYRVQRVINFSGIQRHHHQGNIFLPCIAA